MKRLAGSTWAILITIPVLMVVMHVIAFFLLAATLQTRGRGDPAAHAFIDLTLAPLRLLPGEPTSDALLIVNFLSWSAVGLALAFAARGLGRLLGRMVVRR